MIGEFTRRCKISSFLLFNDVTIHTSLTPPPTLSHLPNVCYLTLEDVFHAVMAAKKTPHYARLVSTK